MNDWKTHLTALLRNYCEWNSRASNSGLSLKFLTSFIWLMSKLSQRRKQLLLSSNLRKVYNDLSMSRYILRFDGIPIALEGAITGSWSGAGDWKDQRIPVMAKLMAVSMLFYYPLEHLAWLKWSLPSKRSCFDASYLSAWSCRFWLCYIIGDFFVSFWKQEELRVQKAALQNQPGREESERALDNKIKINCLQMIRNVLYIIPCLNWSMTKPFVSENVTNGLSLLESIVHIFQSTVGIK